MKFVLMLGDSTIMPLGFRRLCEAHLVMMVSILLHMKVNSLECTWRYVGVT